MLKRLFAMNRHSISHKGSGSLSFVHLCALKRVSMWGTCAYASMHVRMRMASLAIWNNWTLTVSTRDLITGAKDTTSCGWLAIKALCNTEKNHLTPHYKKKFLIIKYLFDNPKSSFDCKMCTFGMCNITVTVQWDLGKTSPPVGHILNPTEPAVQS